MSKEVALLSSYRKLVKAVGAQSARQELRWMKESLSSRDESRQLQQSKLVDLIRRRVTNEPLQYILGAFATSLGLRNIKK